MGNTHNAKMRTITIPTTIGSASRAVRHVPFVENPVPTSDSRGVNPAYNSFSEELIGEVGHGWHSCSHRKMKIEVSSPGLPFTYESAPDQWFDWKVGSWGFWSGGYVPPFPGHALSLISLTRAAELQDRALVAMLPVIRPKVSLVNALIELKDFATLKRSVVRSKTALIHFLGLYAKRPYARRWSLLELRRSCADWFLQWNFNFAPLIGDIVNIYNSLHSTRENVKRLLRDEGQLQLHHYSVDLIGEFPDEYVVSNNVRLYQLAEKSTDGGAFVSWDPTTALSSAVTTHIRTVKYNVARYSATIEYRFILSQFERDNAMLLSFLERLGVRLDPSIVWNAIPWSFVVDWVLGISEWLKRRAVSNITPNVSITNFCTSLKVDKSTSFAVSRSSSTHQGGFGPVVLVESRDSSYQRIVGVPSLTNALRMSGLSDRELSLSAALFMARR